MTYFSQRNGLMFVFEELDPEAEDENVELAMLQFKFVPGALPKVTFSNPPTEAWAYVRNGKYLVQIDHFDGLIHFAKACRDGGEIPHYTAHCSQSLDAMAFILCDSVLLAVNNVGFTGFNGVTAIREIAVLPGLLDSAAVMTLLLRQVVPGAKPLREVLVMNSYVMTADHHYLWAVNIDTGAIRIVAPLSMLAEGTAEPLQFDAMLVDADPARDTLYILNSATYRLIALSGVSGL